MADDPLTDFDRSSFTAGGKSRTVFRLGAGPGVVVLSEMPGITPQVAAFARRVAAEGFTAVLPHLFGDPGRARSAGYTFQSLLPACVSREFATFALRKTSPVTDWLRALSRSVHEELGGPGVGVVGMCFTGGFALGMLADECVLAPVLSQPSLPFALPGPWQSSIGVSDADLAAAKARVADGVCVLGLRFTGDRIVPKARFDRLRQELGDGFVAVEIRSPDPEHGIPRIAHSVLAEHFVDREGHPTREALETVLDLFRTRLLAN